MLRHLGAAYYDSLYGRATRTDVARALGTVEDHLAGQAEHHPAHPARSAHPARKAARRAAHHQPGRWKRRVQDVMTTSVVTIDRVTPYKEIAQLLADHRISGVPVLTMGRHVAGIVSEADLLAVEDSRARRARQPGHMHLPGHHPAGGNLTAADLMTAPAITVHPDAPIPSAARLMTTHHVRRLPVVDPDGMLIGIVTRRDLLSVFLRPDEEIASDATELLDDVLHADAARIRVVVRDGRVILTGTASEPGEEDLIPIAIRLLWDVDGVVDVSDRLNQPSPVVGEPAHQHAAAHVTAGHVDRRH